MDSNERGNNISMVAVITLSVLTILLLIVAIITSIFMPQSYANVVYALGFKTSSLTSYEYAYTRSENINDAYIWMMKSVGAGSSETTVRAYETLADLEDYDDFVKYVTKTNIASIVDPMAKLAVSNEDNYLKGKYVEALIKLGKEQDAFDFAYNDMLSTVITDSNYTYNFALSYFISNVNSENIEKYFTEDVISKIEIYTQDLYNSFCSRVQVNDSNKFNCSVMGYRIVIILRNFNELSYKTNGQIRAKNINVAVMGDDMNTKMYQLNSNR